MVLPVGVAMGSEKLLPEEVTLLAMAANAIPS